MKKPVTISPDYTLDFFDLRQWHKRVGDRVRVGDVLCTYETQKEASDKAADADGVLCEIVVAEGEQASRPEHVTHGSWSVVVAFIETEGASVEGAPKVTEEKKVVAPVQSVVSEVPVVPVATQESKQKMRLTLMPDGTTKLVPADKTPEAVFEKLDGVSCEKKATSRVCGGPKASPQVRKFATEKSVDLSAVTPTGPDGTVTREDVEKVALPSGDGQKPLQSPEEFELLPLTARRKGIAANLTKSWAEIPHAGSEVIVSMSRVAESRAEIRRIYDADPRNAKVLSRWDGYILYAIVRQLAGKWKIINSTFTWEGVRLHSHVNMGISLAGRHGLIVPVIHSLEQRTLHETFEELEMLYWKVKENRLSAKDYKGGTFTFNNPGALGGHNGASIIPWDSHNNCPAGSAILSFHTIDKEMKTILGIRFDHRAYDGLEALGFLVDVKNFLENWSEDV